MNLLGIVAGMLGLVAVAGCAWIATGNATEQPKYANVTQDGDFELRDYPKLTVAEITRSGSRSDAVSAAFRPLAGYIFAKERGGEKIAMTAPVTQTSEDNQEWAVRFIMPSKYTLDTLPRPEGTEIKLVELPPQRMAAIRFSGVATKNDELVAENEARLRAWMIERGLPVLGPATYAYYNDPFTPGFLRRNEVMLPTE